MEIKKKCRGYNASRLIGGHKIPQRVQNLVIRDFAKRHQLDFLLSATEYAFNDFFHVFNGIVEEINDIDGIIFYSLEMLPISYQSQEKLLLPFINKSKQVHFAIENISLSCKKDLLLLKEIAMVKTLSQT